MVKRLTLLTLTATLAAAALVSGCGSSGAGGNHKSQVVQYPPDGPSGGSVVSTAATGATAIAPPPKAKPTPAVPPKPRIIQNPIPFGAMRKQEMVAYAQRHYGLSTYKLRDPRVIVIHYTETPDLQSTIDIFAPDVPDAELHELPGTCAHFVIEKDGTINQLVPLGIMCRHTVGLNWTAIGIEHVGMTDAEVLGDHKQMAASLRLTRWLSCRYGIKLRNVIGHNESLASPYHRENVAALRSQTHDDFNKADMQTYRARLKKAGDCPSA